MLFYTIEECCIILRDVLRENKLLLFFMKIKENPIYFNRFVYHYIYIILLIV